MLETDGLDIIPVVAKNIKLFQSFSLPVGIGIPLVIIGVLTGFHPGQSTRHERVWTMTWLVFGGFLGFDTQTALELSEHIENPVVTITLPILFALQGVGTIGGLVTVGKMLKEYGNCIRLG